MARKLALLMVVGAIIALTLAVIAAADDGCNGCTAAAPLAATPSMVGRKGGSKGYKHGGSKMAGLCKKNTLVTCLATLPFGNILPPGIPLGVVCDQGGRALDNGTVIGFDVFNPFNSVNQTNKILFQQNVQGIVVACPSGSFLVDSGYALDPFTPLEALPQVPSVYENILVTTTGAKGVNGLLFSANWIIRNGASIIAGPSILIQLNCCSGGTSKGL